MPLVTALIAGLLFGAGLILSGMINPGKVLAFLDITGAWDPSLAFVMLGAIPVAAIGFYIMRAKERSVLRQEMQIPKNRQLDTRLMGGAVLFGIGWELVGYCPGPAVASLGVGGISSVIFVIAMVAGMWLYQLFELRYGH